MFKLLMKILEKIKGYEGLIISCIIVSIGSFFIHIKHNGGNPDLSVFLSYLPVTWFLVFCMAMCFNVFFMVIEKK